MSRAQDHNRAVILAALPGTQLEVVAATGLSAAAVCRHLKHATGYDLAHVSAWQVTANGGPPAAVYAAGPGVSPKRPRTQTQKERVAAYRKRRLAKQRAAYAAGKASKAGVRDSLTAAFFGRA